MSYPNLQQEDILFISWSNKQTRSSFSCVSLVMSGEGELEKPLRFLILSHQLNIKYAYQGGCLIDCEIIKWNVAFYIAALQNSTDILFT